MPRQKSPAARRALAARIIIGLLFLAVPGMIGSIAYRSFTIHMPTTLLEVGADSSLDGAKIEVTCVEPYKILPPAYINRYDDWQSPILLDPGKYHIRVTHRDNELLNTKFEGGSHKGVHFELPSMVMIVGSRSLADARFELTYSGGNPSIPRLTDVKLTAQDHFRRAMYLTAGENYRITARSAPPGDQVLAQADFFVDRANPIRIDLGRIYEEGE